MDKLTPEQELRLALHSVEAELKAEKARNQALNNRIITAEGMVQLSMAGKPCNCRDAQILRNCVLAFGFDDAWWKERSDKETLGDALAHFDYKDAEFRAIHGIEG